MKHFTLLIGMIVCLGIACTPQNDVEEEAILLAQVYNRSLYFSEVEDLLYTGMTQEDSTLMVNAYIERWVRDALLMHEAERNIPQDLNIDALVRDYRSSLVLYNYERILIEAELDSTISAAQIEEFYQENKEQYQLKNPIVRSQYVKIPNTAPNLSQASEWWSASQDSLQLELVTFCNRNAEVLNLEGEKWVDLEEVARHFPSGMITKTNINTTSFFVRKDENYTYFFRLLEVVSVDQEPPLAYIENQAKQIILHKRKQGMLAAKREKLYEQELNRNNVKIYNNE